MRTKELRDLVISALVLACAFGIAFSGGFRAFLMLDRLINVVLMSIIAVSSGFVLHEIGHRFIARRFGCFAEYSMWPLGLIIALAGSLFGFIFAAPGAVHIYPGMGGQGATLTREKSGIISVAGPALNLSLAVLFMLLNMAHPMLLFALGARINTWLAIFNLIPFGPLDGMKVFAWSKKVWGIVIGLGVVMYIVQRFAL